MVAAAASLAVCEGQDDAAMLAVVAAAYDSALDPALWPHLLERLGRTFRSGFVDVFARTHNRSRWYGLAHGMDEAVYQDVFLGTWMKRNVWGERRPVVVAGEIVSTRTMMTPEELVRTEMYADFLEPHGLHEGLRLSLWAGEGWIQDISLLRPWSAGPFEGAEIAWAQHLLPHLQRAAAVTRLLREAGPVAQLGLAALDGVRQAAFVLDDRGYPLRFNRRAEVLASAADGLTMKADGLHAGGLPLWGELRGLLVRGLGTGSGETLRLARPSGRPPLRVTAVPISADNDWSALVSPAVLVLVEEPDRPCLPDTAELAARFGLTAAEAEVAAHLAAGLSLSDIATQLGRSLATVRTHLARLMSKAGVQRQAALVHKLLQPGPEAITAARPRFG